MNYYHCGHNHFILSRHANICLYLLREKQNIVPVVHSFFIAYSACVKLEVCGPNVAWHSIYVTHESFKYALMF